jgi:hypothetical protein
MPSLTSGVKWERQDGLLTLLHAYDHILFAKVGDFDVDVWARTLRTLDDAKFNVRMAYVLAVPGMGGLR